MEAGVTPEYDPRPVNEPIPDPIKATAPRDVARRSELAQVREDIRKLAKNITPLSDNDHMDEEWPTRLRLLLERYNELVKEPK